MSKDKKTADPEEKKPRLTLDSNLRLLDKALKIAEQLNQADLTYLMARLDARLATLGGEKTP